MSIHGTSGFLELVGRRRGLKSGRGIYKERRWEGPTANVDLFVGFEMPGGWIEWEAEEDGELSVVSATYQTGEGGDTPGFDGLIAREWELDGNDLELSVWQHEDIVRRNDEFFLKEVLENRRLIEEVISGEREFIEPPENSTEPYDLLVDRLIKGVEAFSRSQYVLRKTERVLRNSTLRPSHRNTNRQFTYARLLSAEPTLSDDNYVAAAELTHLVWLKRTPKVKPTTGGLWEISLEYWGADEWDSWLYKEPV